MEIITVSEMMKEKEVVEKEIAKIIKNFSDRHGLTSLDIKLSTVGGHGFGGAKTEISYYSVITIK